MTERGTSRCETGAADTAAAAAALFAHAVTFVAAEAIAAVVAAEAATPPEVAGWTVEPCTTILHEKSDENYQNTA